MSNYLKIRFKDFATVNPGQSPPSTYYSKKDGMPFLQGNRTFGILYPTIDTYTTKTTKIAEKGEILMSVRAPVGDLNFAQEKVCIGRGVAGINAKDSNNTFLFYCLKYNIQNLIRQGGGTTYDSVNKDVINDFELIMPKSEKERAIIAKTLSDLDAKIELNNKINAELEAMAKLIYDYWFVQFEFPVLNPDGTQSEVVGYKSSGGKMVWNEELKREVPEGWEVKTLDSWILKDKSGDWGKETLQGNYTEKVYCIRGADLNGLNGKGEVKAPERFILEKNAHKMLEPHDLIVEISGGSPTQSTGRMAYITNDSLQRFDAPIICSNFCKAVTLKKEKSLYNFAFEWYKAYDHGVLFGFEGKTSGIKNLLFESFVSSYSTPVAPLNLMAKFYDLMTPLESQKQKNLQENQKLVELRDWLLPMLMNGQVRVK